MYSNDCPFCLPNYNEAIKSRTYVHPAMHSIPEDIKQQFFVKYDSYPVSPGHSLIITKEHYRDITVLPDRFFPSFSHAHYSKISW